MSLQAVTADEATRTVLCKVRDCEEVADGTRGPYAHLCFRHARDKREGLTIPGLPQTRSTTPARATSPSNPSSYESRAKELVAAGKRLDRAFEKAKAPQVELKAAHQAWRELLERLSG